jgi:anti-sigma regulatory factor (Ser/Thr protein kinase)
VAARGIQKRVPATADQVPLLRRAVTGFADAHCDHASDVQHAVALAVTEACANAVLRAYPDRDGELALSAGLDDGHLVVEIADDGIGLDGSSRHHDGLGLGLPLMHELAEAQIASDRAGTRVQLRFPRWS